MSKTKEQIEGEAALERMKRALAGKRDDHPRDVFPQWLYDIINQGKDKRT